MKGEKTEVLILVSWDEEFLVCFGKRLRFLLFSLF